MAIVDFIATPTSGQASWDTPLTVTFIDNSTFPLDRDYYKLIGTIQSGGSCSINFLNGEKSCSAEFRYPRTYDVHYEISACWNLGGSPVNFLCEDWTASTKYGYITVTALPPPPPPQPPTPDLTIVSMPVPKNAFVEDPIFTSFTVKNNGTSDAGRFNVSIYLSQDGQIVKLLNETSIESLPQNSIKTVKIKLQLPSNILSADYSIVAIADKDQTIEDKNPVNNALTQLLPVGHKYALLCGISDYPISAGIPAASDVGTLKQALSEVHFTDANIRPLKNEGVTRSAIENAIQGFNMTPQDMFFFLFSGHGQDDAGIIVLTPGKKPKEELYSYPLLFEALDRANTYKTIVLLDSCYSGDAINNIPKSSQKYIVMTSSNENSNTWGDVFRVPGRHFSFIDYFSLGISTSYKLNENTKKTSSISYPADGNKDGIITANESFVYARKMNTVHDPQIFPRSAEISILTYDLP
jgi:hypothetical protein